MLSQEQQQKFITALLKKPENALCADCGSKSPCWASLDFGVFVCMNCSGAHRALGQSVTRIKSTKLDTWNKDWLWHMQLDNKLINEYYQFQKTSLCNRKPNPNTSLNQIKKFVYDKYVRKLFARQGEDDPITNLKKGNSPLKKLDPVENKTTQNLPQKKFDLGQQKKIGPKSVNQQITVKIPNKKIQNLLDDVSGASNREPSIQNQKRREEVNLFEQAQVNTQYNKNSLKPDHHNLYNKQHYNSFSGKGAQHSTTGQITFENIFAQSSHSQNVQKNKNINFDEFKNISTAPINNTYGQPHIYGQYGHIHHHHFPHMNVYSTTVGGYNAHHQPHTFHNPPTHVTMNINMNMYSNVTNLSLNDNPKPVVAPTLPTTITDHIKLDVGDFVKPQPASKETPIKSWVDDWK